MSVRPAESVRDDLGLVGDHRLPCEVERFLEDAVRRGRFRQQRNIARGAARENDVCRGEAADGRVGLREERDGRKVRRRGGEGRTDDRPGVRDIARRRAVAGAGPLSGMAASGSGLRPLPVRNGDSISAE